MWYIFKLTNAWILRSLIHFVTKVLKSNPIKPPNPFRTIELIRKAGIYSLSDEKDNEKGGKKKKIRCDIYLPTSTEGDQSVLPVVLNLHGSGFMMHTMGDDADFCQKLADEVPCIVVDTDYAKAPELPYPNANLDIDTVLRWIQGDSTSSQKQSLEKVISPVQTKKDYLALTGFSSGGNLVLTACIRANGRNELEKIKAVVAFYPSTNLSESPWEKPNLRPAKQDSSGAVLPPGLRNFFYNCYVPKEVHTGKNKPFPIRSSAEISPLYGNAKDFPQSVTIITCSGDSLSREGRQMAEHIVAGRQEKSSTPNDNDAKDLTKSDPPSNVEDVERVAIQQNVDQNGVYWWQAEGQGHGWDKQTKPNTKPDKLKQESYSLVIERLRKAFA